MGFKNEEIEEKILNLPNKKNWERSQGYPMPNINAISWLEVA